MKPLGQLKLALLQRGLHVPENLRQSPEVAAALQPADGREEIVLALDGDLIVRVRAESGADNRACLQLEKGAAFVALEDTATETALIPAPEFLKIKLPEPATGNISLDGYCLNFFLRAAGTPPHPINLSRECIVSVVQSAFEEGAADLIQFNMDYCQDETVCLNHLAPVIDSIKKKFSTFVALRGFPPRNRQIIDKFYAYGVDLINYPLEGATGQDPSALAGNPIVQGLEYAVETFPQGAVSTELTFGPADSIDTLCQTIDRLARAGIVPTVRLPLQAEFSGNRYAELCAVLSHLARTAQEQKLGLKWLFPTSHSATPLDTSYFTESAETARLRIQPVYRSRIGKKASEGFAALRRKLRVKNISDSYESAGL